MIYIYYFIGSSELLDEVHWVLLSYSLEHTAHRALAAS